MPRNQRFSEVDELYLFQEIREKRAAFQKAHPDAKLISLSIGDTSEPIPSHTMKGLVEAAMAAGTPEGYIGYGPEQGILPLREAISQKFYPSTISPNDIFVSDGAKCDLGRLQLLFHENAKMAIPDPAYPVYVDTSIIHRGKNSVILLPVTPENDFFPDLERAKKADVLILCSPNNPTGKTLSHMELNEIVSFAKREKKIIIFDAAYMSYVQKGFPRSIYEVEGAKEVAIEVGSFSKMAGFSGIRLGWTVVPSELKYPTGESVRSDFLRIITTFYNGASIISQKGGLQALSKEGYEEMQTIIDFYLENGKILRDAFEERGFEVFGGVNAPYLWVRRPGKSSWELFHDLLENHHIVTTPGEGFGTCGKGFLRISCFGKRAMILEAIERLSSVAAVQ